MAKRSQRTPEQQEYRDNLAKYLKENRKQWISWVELAEVLIYEKQTSEYLNALGEGRKVEIEVAEKLIEDWYSEYLIEYLDKFKWSDHQRIAEKMIENRKWWLVVKYLEKFDLLNHEKIVEKLIENWDVDCLAYHYEKLNKFKISDPKMLDALLNTGYARIPRYYLENCEGLTHKEIAERRVDIWRSRSLATNLDKFEWLSKNDWLSKEIAMRLIDSDRDIATKCFLENFDKFELTDEEVMEIVERVLSIWYYGNYIANNLIRAWYWDVVAKHPEKFWLKKEK